MIYEKPPIGVAPHWFVYLKRMTELNEAIARYLDYINTHKSTLEAKQEFELIAKWSKEIQTLARLEAELEANP